MHHHLHHLIFLLLILTACSPQKETQEATENATSTENYYLFSYFSGIQSDTTGNGQDGLHLAYSKDLLHWEELNGGKSVLKPVVGKDSLMRDPCIAQGPDGTFHMVWTVSWNDKAIGYASSKDLIHWSEQQAIYPFGQETDVLNCWAPELTYDPANGQFMIYWSSTFPDRFPETAGSGGNRYNHRIYHILTSDFETFTPAEVLYEPGFNSIDASIYPDGDRWVMFIKDETKLPEVAKNLKLAFAENLTGPYSPATEPFTESWVEGPTALQTDSLWYLYYDRYHTETAGRPLQIELMVSEDLKTWRNLTDRLEMPKGMRHGTVLEVSGEVMEGLLEAYGK